SAASLHYIKFHDGIKEITLEVIRHKKIDWYQLSVIKALMGFSKNYKRLGNKLGPKEQTKAKRFNIKGIKSSVIYINMAGVLKLIIMSNMTNMSKIIEWILCLAASMVNNSFIKFKSLFRLALKKKKPKEGFIYVVNSSLFPTMAKIGKTVNMQNRLNCLNTSIPKIRGNYKILRKYKVKELDEIEKYIHREMRKKFSFEKEHYKYGHLKKFLSTFDELIKQCVKA
ncbi:MAG: GIY-YIG nuclease family protein, partial [Janthinobacterium lividum]